MPLSNKFNFEVLEIHEQKGSGLFATRRFEKNEQIYQFDYWSKVLMPIHMTNHSCDPNASFDKNGMLVALRQIEAGEEITYDYLEHPIPAAPWNFKCGCNSADCIGWVSVNSDLEK